MLVFVIAIDAFLIEPHWLEITHKTIQCSKLQRPIRIAIIADIQTDVPGEYESNVFQYVKKASPDLVLFLGDYIQTEMESHYTTLGKQLNTILHNADFNVPMGAYAVKGNIDHAHTWKNIFAGLPIRTIEETTTIDLGPLVLTGLSMADSFDSSCSIEGNEQLHIVFGHCPNFSLGRINADLLIAGHTHGGQVRLPGIGPLLTLCKVSRDWASGFNQIKEGQFLYVSRGIGMERHDAPRMRFLCRPELVILDLQP